MKAGAFVSIALAGFLAGGCLTVETCELHAKLDPSGSGTYEMVWRNIQSDDTTGSGQASDFADLMKAWQEDEYLLDGVRKGLYVKRRDVTVDDGVLVGREEGLFLKPDALNIWFGPGGRIRFDLGAGDSLISTNGTFNPDSQWVEWAPDTRELDFVARSTDFDPQFDFVSTFGKRAGQ